MKKKALNLFVYVFIVFLLSAQSVYSETTVTLQGPNVSDDKMVYNNTADTTGVRIWNTTADQYFYTVINPYSSTQIYQSFLKFDLSSIPVNSVVTSASLGLYKYGFFSTTATNITFSIYQVTQNWDEITNNFFPAINPSVITSTLSPATVGWVTFNITNLVGSSE